MVDFRPVLFINALAFMLLVTAGFASVREEIAGNTQHSPALSEAVVDTNPKSSRKSESVYVKEEVSVAASRATPSPAKSELAGADQAGAKPEPSVGQGNIRAETFTIDNLPENAPLLAKTQSQDAITQTVNVTAPLPSTGRLVLRSNVVGDQVSINGKEYGATRLDLELKPGIYDVIIRKDGHEPWQQKITLNSGDERTLVGELHAITNVNYRNGTWVGGVKTGEGTLQNDQGLRYEGHFVDGKFHGEGTAWYPDGSKYDGDWRGGQRHGEGSWRSADETRYTGQFSNDQFSGQGTLTLSNGDILTGQWAEGKLNGHGSLTTADGMLYVGGFRNDDFHGEGTLTYPDGRLYEGEFSNGEFHGKGKEVFANGKQYEGEYIEGSFHGKGLLSNPNGSSIQATFRYGEPYGKVHLTTAAGEIFTARTTEPGVCYRDKSYRATQCPTLEGW